MGWHILIVPLIVLVVWILSTIFKAEDPNEVRMRMRPRRPDNPPGGPRRPVPVQVISDEGSRPRSTVDAELQATSTMPPPPPRPVLRTSPPPPRPRRASVPVPVTIIEEPPVMLPVRETPVTLPVRE